jgi:hypothetical protein
MSFVPYQDAKDVADRFLTLLSKREITPPRGAAVETEMLSLVELLEIWSDPVRIREMAKNAHVIRQAAGIHDLAAKVLSSKKLPEFKSLEKHLEMIAQAREFTTVAQNLRADGRDDISRKIAEMYVGCLAIHCGTGVVLDDPIHAKGDNPDVMLQFNDQRWALAVKTLVSDRHGQTIFDNIKSAAQQIDASQAEKGLVVLNAKNVINHDSLWKPARPFADAKEATEALIAELRRLADLAAKDRAASDWDEVFSRKTVPPVIFMGQGMAYLPLGGGFHAPTPLKAMATFDADHKPDEAATDLAHSLNHWMQSLLRGLPGPPPS